MKDYLHTGHCGIIFHSVHQVSVTIVETVSYGTTVIPLPYRYFNLSKDLMALKQVSADSPFNPMADFLDLISVVKFLMFF